MSSPAPRSTLPALLLIGAIGLAATAGVAAVWAALAVLLGSNCLWMAPLAALDAALLLRLSGLEPGRRRAWAALSITAATVAGSAVLVSAARLGSSLGMRPVESLDRLSPGLLGLYFGANTGWTDGLWLLAAAGMAWRLGR